MQIDVADLQPVVVASAAAASVTWILALELFAYDLAYVFQISTRTDALHSRINLLVPVKLSYWMAINPLTCISHWYTIIGE